MRKGFSSGIGGAWRGMLVLVQLAGCASPLSRAALSQVSPNLVLAAVLAEPDRYKGQTVVVAGPVLSVENRAEGALLQVLGYPTTGCGFPDTGEPALGRFAILHPAYLDPLIYLPGRQVTTVGRIAGSRPLKISQAERWEPLLRSLELRLLPESPTYYAPMYFGVGFSFGF